MGAVEFEAYPQKVRENMKLTVETKVGAAISAGFITLTAIAIAQGNSESETGGPSSYSPTNTPRTNTHISQQGDNNSLQPALWVDAIRL
jgi:hypothetical protein